MQELKAADDLLTLENIPALRLHRYKGNRIGIWSIDIHKNWRICFEIDQSPIPKKNDGSIILEEITSIKILSVEDPH